jgi:hypothetical protein
VFGVPNQAGVPGEHSGRQRKQGLKPASVAAAAVGKYRTFFSFAGGAGQIERQYTPLENTPMKNLPSKRASRVTRAREQTCQSSSIFLNRFFSIDDSADPARIWTFSDYALDALIRGTPAENSGATALSTGRGAGRCPIGIDSESGVRKRPVFESDVRNRPVFPNPFR